MQGVDLLYAHFGKNLILLTTLKTHQRNEKRHNSKISFREIAPSRRPSRDKWGRSCRHTAGQVLLLLQNSSKCKGGGRHLLQFELECSIYKVGRYHSTEAIVILLKSFRIGIRRGAHVLFSLALYVCNWYILQFLPPLKHNSQFTPALLISRPKVWIVMVAVWVSIAQSIWRILVRMQQTVQAAAANR